MPTVLLPRLTVSDIDNCPTVVDIDDVANHIFVCDHCWNSVEALFQSFRECHYYYLHSYSLYRGHAALRLCRSCLSNMVMQIDLSRSREEPLRTVREEVRSSK